MTKLLEEAFSEARKLSQEEQDALANWLLAEIASEHGWEERFSCSQDLLAQLADEALEEQRSGRTLELDPDAL